MEWSLEWFFIELILIDFFSVFVKCFYKNMVHELVREVKLVYCYVIKNPQVTSVMS